MKKLGALALAAAIVLAPTAAHAEAAPADADAALDAVTTYSGRYISEYTAQYYINADGTIDVTIDFTFDFNGEYGHGPYVWYVTRLSYDDENDRFYNFSNVQASSSTGAPSGVNSEWEKYGVAYKIGDPDIGDVTGVHQYRLTYTVDGYLNSTSARDYDEAITPEDDEVLWDEFYINVIGDSWEIPLDNVTIIIGGDAEAIAVTPPGSSTPVGVQCFTGYRGSTDQCDVARLEDGRAVFGQAHLDPGEFLTTVVAFPAGSFDTTPIVRTKNDLSYAFSVNAGTGYTALALLGLSVMLLSRRIRGKAIDEQYAGLTPGLAPTSLEDHQVVKRDKSLPIAVRFEPPKDFRPGQLGTLLDEKADVRDVTATIVDLAVRGYMRIEEVGVEEGKRAPKNPDYKLIKLKEADDALVEYEQTLFAALFGGGDETTFEDLKTTFASDLAKVRTALYKDVTKRGWFRGNPQTARVGWAVSGCFITALGIGLTIFFALTSSWALVPLPIILLGIMTLFTTKAAPARKAEGTRILVQAQGFEQFLSTADGNKLRFEEGKDIFSLYLPYAIAFGVADKWTATFAKLAKEGVALAEPTWYGGGYHGTFWVNSGSFGQSMNSFASIASSAMSAPPPGSSGGSGFGGGGFGGGGGFSGGGGGGGGGGGW